MKRLVLAAALTMTAAAAAIAQPGASPPPGTPAPSAPSSPGAQPSSAPTTVPTVPPATPVPTVPPATPMPTAPPPTPAPTARAATPAPQRNPAPPAAPTPTYNFIYRATPSPGTVGAPGTGSPQINEIDLSDATIVTPGAIHVRVLTSDAVTSVIAQTFGRSIAIPQRGSGIFALDANISEIPAFLKGRSYPIDFVASVADGRKADVSLPLVLK